MKRFLIILESLLLSVNSIYAESIGEEKAMKIAKNFFGQQVSQKIQMIDPDKWWIRYSFKFIFDNTDIGLFV